MFKISIYEKYAKENKWYRVTAKWAKWSPANNMIITTPTATEQHD